MPNSYTQIYIQAVFAVKYRRADLDKSWRSDLFNVMGKIINDEGCQSLIVNGVEDHVHCLFKLKPDVDVSRVIQRVKGLSSKWINDNALTESRFHWQTGYGAFSYHQSALNKVKRYIERQEQHHRKKSFLEEYKDFLQKFEIDYEEVYIFNDPI